MALASPALFLVYFYTHSLRCGLEECRQLRWLCPKNHTVRALEEFRQLRWLNSNFPTVRALA